MQSVQIGTTTSAPAVAAGEANKNQYKQESAEEPIVDTAEEEEKSIMAYLFAACEEGDFELVKQIFEEDGQYIDLDEVDDDYWGPVHFAVRGGNVSILAYLIEEKGADLDSFIDTEEGQDALCFAVNFGNLDMVRFIAKIGGEKMLHHDNERGLTPLHMACLEGHPDIVRCLLDEYNVSAQTTDKDRWTPLHYASLVDDLDTVIFLVEEHAAAKDATEMDGWTPLHCAANRGNLTIVQYLLEDCGVDRNALVDSVSQNALHLATSEGHLNVVKYLIEEQGFDACKLTDNDDTAFHLAATYGQFDIIKYFMEDSDSEHARKQMIYCAVNKKGQTAYDIARDCVQTEDEYADQSVLHILKAFFALIVQPVSEDEKHSSCANELRLTREEQPARTSFG